MRLSEALLESMSMIDEKYLAQSETEKRNVFAWKPVLSFAAVCLLVMVVIILPPRMKGAPSADSAAEPVEEETMTDSIIQTVSVLYDQQLTEYLASIPDDGMVRVWIETVNDPAYDFHDEAKEADTASYGKDSSANEVLEMSKREILNFEAEEGITYIFHLYNEDDME